MVISGHVHNYEHHEHNGVVYFVTGGGGAHAYPIERRPMDLFQSAEINYHYIDINVQPRRMVAIMNRLEFKNGTPASTQPEMVNIVVPAGARAIIQPKVSSSLSRTAPDGKRLGVIGVSRLAVWESDRER